MKSLNIFIAEDESIILRNFMIRVERMGHKVIGVALDGIEAEKKIRELKPDMLIMDINMPGKDGLSIIKAVNEESLTPSIIVTGHYSTELINKAMEVGVFSYLMKPVDGNQLEAAINVAWKKYVEFMEQFKETKELRTALKNRKFIEKAKGILMDRFGLKEDEAMKRMQKMSKDKNKKLQAIAQEIIAANERFDI